MNKPKKRREIIFGLGKEKEYFLENLSALLSSGMPMIEAMGAISEEVRSNKFKKIIQEMAENLKSGFSFSQAIEDSGIFSQHVASLIRIGERSGKLVENLKILAVEQEKETALKSKIRSATMYPAFVLFLTLVVGVGIAWFILPKLATVFSQLKISLPLITRMLISSGLFLNQSGMYAIPAFFVGLFLIFYFVFGFSKTKFMGEAVLFSLPGIKNLLKETELARFGYLFGTLLNSGLSPTESLDAIAGTTPFLRYRRLYLHLKESLKDGHSLKGSFTSFKKSQRLVPAPVISLIVAGEQSGNLSLTLLKIAQNYETKTDTTTKDLTVILEPILLVIVWLGVVGVALAVILPIYSLIGGLNQNL
jgi:type II secretory pathway component PulF